MSIADKVGESASFGRARNRSARGRAKALTEDSIPAYELVRLALDQVSPTPLNPRRNFGSADEKTRFGEELREAQLAACVAVTREAYLKLWPEHDSAIGTAHYVLVNGERRFRSAVHVGLDKLDFVVRDDLASAREDFVDHLLAENLDREDFDVIERARGVEQLVSVCAEDGDRGARSRAAKRLGKDRSWVTNQLALLTLPTEIQVMLSVGEVSERDGRSLARHLKENPAQDSVQLLAHLTSVKEAADQHKAEEQRLLAAGRAALTHAGSPGSLSADNKRSAWSETAAHEVPEPAPEAAGSDDLLSADNKPGRLQTQPAAGRTPEPAPEAAGSDDLLSADNKLAPLHAENHGRQVPLAHAAKEHAPPGDGDGRPDEVPVPRRELHSATSPSVVTGVRFPYDNASLAADYLNDRMDDTQFMILVEEINEMAKRRMARPVPE
ncbi:ParB/RepB/Spo0J family partition protein [Streptomyces sp. NPDC060184]|uniref:ParB/RepB/Spo0J family partition protein n=1 Tax=Streptomyces sp. NPDC060184 TaxID=3347064 RepID=UPI00364702A6